MSFAKPTTVVSWFVSILVMFAFAGLITSCVITIGIWPGEVKLLAPFFCTDAQPDAFVVADTYNPHPGETVTNFSLYCMGPRGDATDHGFMKPFLLISAIHGLIIVGPMVLFTSVGRLSATATGMTNPRTSTSATNDEPFGGFGDFSEFSDADDTSDDDDERDDIRREPPRREPPRRSPAPPGSTPGPFVD
ncbi:hypothetical protein [Ilumatobacter coccineus]|uniref:Uncharacterized protein n=1 Tax=Ilumatobacter coccineus (strain NBRC 103263 / KCTC 29153 / YM16-304) TaxID=1313172 RepID=A0A6C7E1N2_ILUCY|nr:hypothetical protein [Ilumatobacter coccineus]BAN00432.1 hypothetical protein YM304_01180 [Ilumatobacter coccineus YM16-304]